MITTIETGRRWLVEAATVVDRRNRPSAVRLLWELKPVRYNNGQDAWEIAREIDVDPDGRVTWRYHETDNDTHRFTGPIPDPTVEVEEGTMKLVDAAEFEALWAAPLYRALGPLARLARWARRT